MYNIDQIFAVYKKLLAVVLGGLLLVFTPGLLARTSVADLEARLEDLENKIENNFNLELANKVDSLEQEVQELRGTIEELQNATNRQATKPTGKATLGLAVAAPVVAAGKSAVVQQPSAADQEAYNAAYRLIESKDFPEAIVAFKDFLWQYQDSKYAPHATYWLGELYLTEDKLELASDYFLKVTEKYKQHTKAPDALFKLGMLEMERDNWQIAKDYFTKIKQEYSDSSRVYMANAQLKILEQEGH
jgi:tol-pal system protein YbgF